ncbi:MAG: M20 family metallo-hydrolase [Bacteroidaceae bacterium]|nr:M20 family metallo-hydrolase [Bacteroidaceae bacterium]
MQNMNIANSSSQAVQLLSQLIETPRISREESQASQLLYDYMTEVCHLEVKRHGCNLWTIAPDFDANKPTLLLNAHIDTVKPVSGWQKDPWKATLEDDCLYGLGSNDDGASLVTLLHAFIELSSKHQPYNLVYLASAEEEVSGKNGIELVIPLLPRIDVAIVGEPTGMHPAIAEKGLMVLDVTAHGKAGHAARNEGDNAIYHAMDDMQWFRTYQWPLSSPLLGPVKMSVTIVNSGTQHNVIPDTCTFTVDVRSNECYTNQELYNAICSQVKSKVKARSFRLGSSRIAPDHPLVTKAVQMGRVPFGSPTLSDQALMPWPSMKMGPGDSSRSHTADEFIRISEIEEAIQLYVEWLDGLRF